MVKSLIPAQRHDRIQALLEQRRVASIAEMSDLLQVSEATIRRDLEALEEQGALERTHGGAILTRRLPTEPFYSLSATLHPAQKREIGAARLPRRAGRTTPGAAEAEIARLMLERTRGPVVVVADASKWGVVSNYEIAPIDQVDILVSDRAPPAEAVAGLSGRGVKVIRARADADGHH